MTPERFQKIKKILNKRQPDLTIIMDNVHKPHNLAAIIRSCDAIGIGHIHHISKNHNKVGVNLKAASGSNHWVKLYTHENKKKLFTKLRNEGHTIFAANNSVNAIDFREANYTNASTIILGAELDGVSNEAINLADQEIRIPMEGMVESLNVSVANAVILFEIQRQRQKANLYKNRRIDKDEYKRLLFEFSYPEVAEILNKNGKSYPILDKDGQIIN